MTAIAELNRDEISVIRRVFDWIHFDPATSKFVHVYTPRFFATASAYKLAMALIESMNKHVADNEHGRFVGSIRAWDSWRPGKDSIYRTNVQLLETAVISEFSYQVVTLPFDPNDPLRETNQAVSFWFNVNGKSVEFNDAMRVSEAARCVLTLHYIRDQMKGSKHGC